jgi:tol-pal system protein YbgF
MTQRSARFPTTRLAACIAAAGIFFAAPASAQTTLPAPQYGSADAWQDRIEELETQLREATAENERLQNQLNQRDREIQRLRSMVGELAGVNQQLSSPPADGATPPPGGSPPANNAPRAEASPAPSTLNSAQQAQTGTLGTIPADAAPAPPVLSADESYARAMAFLTAGNNAQAETAFADFLERFPNVTQTANARYWYGFTLLAGGKHRDAAASFVQYLRRAPRGPRAPEAQVGLGLALLGMGERQQGCAALNSVPRQYPNADQAVRTRAAREARAANCAA